ncbi:MAG: hypothetical protein FAZ92_01236 [Accumulibacter sp.]|uniref:hypothetical protein n=1 Tax=Accumulibacter sp. TaxID=2053492 RepID=UPI00121512C3|nr:hypothetical protein [Accumulibacter sp.]TLD46499.1 MAG: hypothetical protein FAZ92_01236 [Accumulibacter sp.]
MLDEYSIERRTTQIFDARSNEYLSQGNVLQLIVFSANTWPVRGVELLRGIELLCGGQLPVGCRDAVVGRSL